MALDQQNLQMKTVIHLKYLVLNSSITSINLK
jgi:hypothetical protein